MTKELDLISKVTTAVKKEWKYSNDGEAFAHLFVRNYLNIDDSGAAEACQVGFLGNDKGIDAFYVDEDAGTIYIFGVTKQKGSLGPKILTEIERSHDFLSTKMGKGIKNDLQQTWISYKDWKDSGFSVTYVRAVLGQLNDEAKGMLNKLSNEVEKDKWTIEIWEGQDTVGICLPIRPAKGPNVEFEIIDKHSLIRDTKGLPRATVFSVRGDALAEVVKRNRNNIFELNLREYMGPNPVNKRIAESLANPESHSIFWYLNLGIDAICDEFGPPSQQTLSKNPKFNGIAIKNFRIVNGCQTCVTLAKNIPDSKHVSVMVRLVETTDKVFGRNIAECKNRQTAIKDRDLVALDKTQCSILAGMDSQTPPFFYQRRVGEWNSRKNTFEYRNKFGERWVDNKDCAKAHLAIFRQDPFGAKHKTKKFFQSKQDGGLYEHIFHRDLNVRNLIIADEIYQVVLEQNKKQRKEYRRLTKESKSRPLSEKEETTLKNLSYYMNADTYLAALIWYISTNFLDQDTINKHLISLDRPIIESKKNNLVRLYEIACKPVLTRVSTEESVRVGQKLHFSIRDYFAKPDTYEKLKLQTVAQIDKAEVLRVLSA